MRNLNARLSITTLYFLSIFECSYLSYNFIHIVLYLIYIAFIAIVIVIDKQRN